VIDITKGLNVALVEHAEGRQQRFRFVCISEMTMTA
jgi:hypothetical protein